MILYEHCCSSLLYATVRPNQYAAHMLSAIQPCEITGAFPTGWDDKFRHQLDHKTLNSSEVALQLEGS